MGLLEESLALSRHVGSKQAVLWCLDALGELAGARGQPHRAARLWGAAEKTREEVGASAAPRERERRGRIVPVVRARLDAAAFGAAWAEGRARALRSAERRAGRECRCR